MFRPSMNGMSGNQALASIRMSGPYAIAVDSAANKAYVIGLTDTLTEIDGRMLTAASVATTGNQ